MGLQRFENTNIMVDIADAIVQGIVLKRKAHVQAIVIEIEAKRVALKVKVYYYGIAENDGYGEVLSIPGITAYGVELVADNTVLVDAATGETICNADELPNADNENSPLYNRNYMFEFELFAAMMHMPVIVAEMAVAKVQYAASIGRI